MTKRLCDLNVEKVLAAGIQKPKLHIDLVPQPLWGKNLRSNEGLGKYRWQKLRQSILDQRGPSCAICASEAKPHGHETWTYVEKRSTGIARLVGVEIVCGDCHAVHHWGRTNMVLLGIPGGASELNRLIRHACTVNKWKKRTFQEHAENEWTIWKRRSALQWKIDWGQYGEVVSNAKAQRAERSTRIASAGRNATGLWHSTQTR
jgi:hypothetical protein